MARGGFRQVPHLAVEALALCCCSGPAAEELFFGSVTDHADRTHFDQARRSMTIGHRRSHALTHRCFDPMAGVHFTQCSRKRLSACFNLFVPLVFSEIREIMRTFG
jgi:hypothetical protein